MRASFNLVNLVFPFRPRSRGKISGPPGRNERSFGFSRGPTAEQHAPAGRAEGDEVRHQVFALRRGRSGTRVRLHRAGRRSPVGSPVPAGSQPMASLNRPQLRAGGAEVAYV